MSSKPTLEEIRARFRVVCICKGIKLGKIADAIKAGAITVEQVNRATGSGSGSCGNDRGVTRCRPVIEEMLRNGGRPPAPTPPPVLVAGIVVLSPTWWSVVIWILTCSGCACRSHGRSST